MMVTWFIILRIYVAARFREVAMEIITNYVGKNYVQLKFGLGGWQSVSLMESFVFCSDGGGNGQLVIL